MISTLLLAFALTQTLAGRARFERPAFAADLGTR